MKYIVAAARVGGNKKDSRTNYEEVLESQPEDQFDLIPRILQLNIAFKSLMKTFAIPSAACNDGNVRL